MDTTDLKCFIKVYKNKNLTKSAKELFITQQALSRIISNFEKEIGAPLFDRNSRGVTPTELGKYIYSRAEDLIKQFDDFVEDINNKVKAEKRKLKVGFSPGTLQVLGAREVLEQSKECLGIDILISEYSDTSCEANILNGCLDIAFTVNPRNKIDFSFYSLIKDDLVAVVNKNHPIAYKRTIDFKDLKNQKLILLDDTFRMQLVVMEHFKKAGFNPDIYSRCSHDLKIVYDFVTLNKGIFIFVNSLTHIETYNEIISIPITIPTAFWDIGFLVKKDTKINHTMKLFMNYFLNKYDKDMIK
ncbi:DNA-binding transcriptional regulator, LysR family [Anaerovirgula multivorans]|uniref:DNA-binding transcriptional regulator, LysR family n=1 Tax=Anaerovirgula multivorans TaxID=312168 RepID=A0A238ZXS9_9FIRM|nr:LysR family transcriptional regulator [Anaerovirgula multivorans]SNR87811.1 DNA-binding transcriptional regulator, LysR family [Anaerovirgula multivorans]